MDYNRYCIRTESFFEKEPCPVSALHHTRDDNPALLKRQGQADPFPTNLLRRVSLWAAFSGSGNLPQLTLKIRSSDRNIELAKNIIPFCHTGVNRFLQRFCCRTEFFAVFQLRKALPGRSKYMPLFHGRSDESKHGYFQEKRLLLRAPAGADRSDTGGAQRFLPAHVPGSEDGGGVPPPFP